MALALSLLYNFVCASYFGVGRTNILYSACFFVAGGLIYLYQNELAKLNQWIAFGIAGVAIVLYYMVGGNAVMCLLVSSTLLISAIAKRGGTENRLIRFFSSVSMEIYLSHMMVFRMVEKCGINRIFGDGWLQYIATVVIVITGTSVFAAAMQKIIGRTTDRICMKERKNSLR